MRNLSIQPWIASLTLLLFLFSCKKVINDEEELIGLSQERLHADLDLNARTMSLSSSGSDTADTQTVLGDRLPNPIPLPI